MVSDDDWGQEALAEEYGDSAALLVKKSALTRGFSDEGKLLGPVEFKVVGDMSVCMSVFQAHVLHVAILESNRITLQPKQQNKGSQPDSNPDHFQLASFRNHCCTSQMKSGSGCRCTSGVLSSFYL